MIQELTERLEELKQLGYSEEKINELQELFAPEVEQLVFVDYAQKADDDEYNKTEAELKACEDQESYLAVLDKILMYTYGVNHTEVTEKHMASLLGDFIEAVKKIKSKYESYQSGDEAVKKELDELESSDAVKRILEESTGLGLDFQKLAITE